jgi:hypothetical protein
MKKTHRKIELKKHAISVLNSAKLNGGTGGQFLITFTCKSTEYDANGNCISNPQ